MDKTHTCQIDNRYINKRAYQSTYPAATNLKLGAGAGLLDLDGLGILSVEGGEEKGVKERRVNR